MDIFRDSLYGPKRLSSSNAIKNVLQKDHVLQKGEWDCQVTRQDQWITTTSNNFKKPLPALNDARRKVKSVDRDVSSIILGSSSNHQLPTTSKDFERKWLDAPKKAQPNLGTSIPDFATKYLVNNKIGNDGSIYRSSFNYAKKLDTSESTNERKHHTKDLGTTHFHLGDTCSHYDTETSQRFLPSKLSTDNPASISTNAALETYRSNVFRNGDWNDSGHPIMPYSVTRNDFHIKPFTLGRLPRQASRMRSLGEKLNKAIAADLEGLKADDIIQQLFAQYDTNRTGRITKDQLLVIISAYVPFVTQEDISNLITQSNSGEPDGKIDYCVLAEYIASLSTDKAEENETQPFLSIQNESYTGTDSMKTCYPSTNSCQPKDDPSHPYYHISTHFQLGDHHDEQKSISRNDYVLRGPWQLKPLFALPPLSSQVLPESDEFRNEKSTKQIDFVYHAYEDRAAAQAREREMKRNQNRLAKQSIELAADPANAQAYRQASVSGKDYPSPPADFRPLTPRRAPLSKYRHLDTNGALLLPHPDPYLSEKQEKFQNQGSLMMLKEKHIECLERTGDNRTSHFILGGNSEPKSSEQHHQFSKKTPVDSSVLAAGKKQTAEQEYSHVYPSESAERTEQSDVRDVRLKEIKNTRDPGSMNLRKAFLEYDKNLSGKISPEDFQRACNNLNIYIPREELEIMLEGSKTDSQGKIDYFQFVKGFTKQLALKRGCKPEIMSVMKTDYCPPEERSYSSAQKRTIDTAAKPSTSMDFHYFHYDHSKERTKLTTTGHDFSRPDRLESRGLSVF